jgi:putative methanogenesis marker 16 metalloprotein
MTRTIKQINDKIAKGDATVLTAREVANLLAAGKEGEVKQADVVTTGTMGLMSGTYAVLSFPIAKAGLHRRFTHGTINGVPVSIGPAPNESLGIVDAFVFGTQESEEDPNYGGSFLFRDLVEGKEVTVEATSNEGKKVEAVMTINDMGTAKLMSVRNCFRNYRAMVNPSKSEFTSIFSNLPFRPNYGGLTFSGCGHLSPLQNDPELISVGVGTGLLFNGAEGFVFSTGTRCSPKYPNLMTAADMKDMDPILMGGFRTAAGPEVLTTYAIPIPVLNDSILKSVMTRDEDIPLSIADVRDRHKIGQTNYGAAWTGHDEIIAVDKRPCIKCKVCAASGVCPTMAIKRDELGPAIDRSRCVNCGACVIACEQGSFKGFLGDVKTTIAGQDRIMPIVCRNSNREGAVRTMNDLKKRLLDGSFIMREKVANINP